MDVVRGIGDSKLPYRRRRRIPPHTAVAGPMTRHWLDPRPSLRYEVRVRGHLGETMLGAFPALQAETSGKDTVLRGALPDQAALHGVLAEVEALGLELLEVRRLPEDPGD